LETKVSIRLKMKKNINKKELREFAFIIVILCPILIGWLLPYLYGHGFRVWTIFFSLPFLILGLIYPKSLYYPYKAWMKFGKFAGFINSYLILGLIYILIVLPISLVLKILKYDPLNLMENNKNSYKLKRMNSKIDLKKTF